MAINPGLGSALGFGVETVWDTAVARTNWLRPISAGIQVTQDKTPTPHLGTQGATSANRRGHSLGATNTGGPIVVPMAYDDSTMLLLQHLFGAVAEAGGGAPYTHTFTLASPAPVGLTIEQIYGSGQSQVHAGCKITSGEMSFAPNEIARLALDIIGGTSAAFGSAGTPSYSSSQEWITGDDLGTLTFNTVAYTLLGLTLRIDRKLSRGAVLGQRTTRVPTLSDFMEISGSLSWEVQNNNWDAALVADTQGDATVTATGAGGAGPNSAAFTLHDLYLTEVSQPIDRAGVLVQSGSFRCESDGTNEGIAVIVTNDNATAATN